MTTLSEMKAKLEGCGQDHLLGLPDFSEGHPVFQQLLKFDIENSVHRFKTATSVEAEASRLQSAEPIAPVEDVVVWEDLPLARRDAISALGWKALAEGKVAAVIMSGGQGTRLGYAGPKGCYNMGLPSQKSIFQLHVERVAKVRELCASPPHSKHPPLPPQSAAGQATTPPPLPRIPIYIMTSDLNDDTIRSFFLSNAYFGYPPDDIVFFEQRLEPVFGLDGRVLLESPHSLSMAPDGNGGLYCALADSGALADMQARGIEHLHLYGIDNVLTKSVDPALIGVAIEAGAQCANKVVWRADRNEKVGVTAVRGGGRGSASASASGSGSGNGSASASASGREGSRMCVVEYCEIPRELADAADPTTGRLLFGAANICNHYVTR